MIQTVRDHGGGLDAAVGQFGGARADWLDLSTGINPNPFPLEPLPDYAWNSLPDAKAEDRLKQAARSFWNVPSGADILPSAGVSQLIALLPLLAKGQNVRIQGPTYNEHAAAFANFGHQVMAHGHSTVVVHPNNPDGRLVNKDDLKDSDGLVIIDESFCDTCPEESLIDLSQQQNVIILKGLGKFWGLAGMRLGFAIGLPEAINQLRDLIGPWAVSGPALHHGAKALEDHDWSTQTRIRLDQDAARLDALIARYGADILGGTSLFRLYSVQDAQAVQTQLAQKFVWSRIFPYSDNWIRLGLPGNAKDWLHLSNALGIAQ